MVGRGGYLLLEIAFAMVLLLAAGTAFVVSLHAYALQARGAYEERVAREAAAAELERLEAKGSGRLAEGVRRLDVDLPGWANLEAARCELRVGPARDGARRVTVEVVWTGTKGPRRVDAATLLEAAP